MSTLSRFDFKIPELTEETTDKKLSVVGKKDDAPLGQVEVSKNPSNIYVYDFLFMINSTEVHVVAESMTLSTSGVMELNEDSMDKPGRIISFSR